MMIATMLPPSGPVKHGRPHPKLYKLGEFAKGFAVGVTSPVSAWTNIGRLGAVNHTVKGALPREFGRKVGHLTFCGISLVLTGTLISHLPQFMEYLSSLAEKPFLFWMKREIFQSTLSPEVFQTLSETDILSRPVSLGQGLNYFGPYAVAVPIGMANEAVREWTQKEGFSFWKMAYIGFRFLVGTALLVKLGEWTWGMPYLKTFGCELLAWTGYYGAFTIPTAFARGKKPAEIDHILRKQVFYTAVLTSIGLAGLTTLVNPFLLKVLGAWGSLERLGHVVPIVTRGIWETFITQMVLRAEFGGDEFVRRIWGKIFCKQ